MHYTLMKKLFPICFTLYPVLSLPSSSLRGAQLPQTRPGGLVSVSGPRGRVLCGGGDVEHRRLHPVHLSQWACPVWDRGVPALALPEPNQNPRLLLPPLPRWVWVVVGYSSWLWNTMGLWVSIYSIWVCVATITLFKIENGSLIIMLKHSLNPKPYIYIYIR